MIHAWRLRRTSSAAQKFYLRSLSQVRLLTCTIGLNSQVAVATRALLPVLTRYFISSWHKGKLWNYPKDNMADDYGRWIHHVLVIYGWNCYYCNGNAPDDLTDAHCLHFRFLANKDLYDSGCTRDCRLSGCASSWLLTCENVW